MKNKNRIYVMSISIIMLLLMGINLNEGRTVEATLNFLFLVGTSFYVSKEMKGGKKIIW